MVQAERHSRRRWLLWVLIVAFVWLVVSRFTEIEKLALTIRQGQWQWVGAAALLQILFYLLHSMLYQNTFLIVGIRRRLRDMLPLVLASLFVNVVAPTGGTAAIALFMDDASLRGQPAARAAAGMLLTLVVDFSAFSLLLLAGMIYLFLQADLRTYQVVGAILFLLFTMLLSSLLLLGLWQPALLQGVLAWCHRVVSLAAGWLRRPSPLAEDWPSRNASEYIGAAAAIQRHPGRLFLALGVSLASHLVNIACLYAVFLAFRHPLVFGPLVAGYAIGFVFWVISPTPQGVGVVEGVMALVYTSLAVPGGTAVLAALTFRGLTFWAPLAIGFFLLRRVRSFGVRRAA
jgi:hypothetical protein